MAECKYRQVSRCAVCHQEEPLWAMQFMDGDDQSPTFTRLGYHYRGWPLSKVCDACKRKYQDGQNVSR